jgi:hypothetical protein
LPYRNRESAVRDDGTTVRIDVHLQKLATASDRLALVSVSEIREPRDAFERAGVQ